MISLLGSTRDCSGPYQRDSNGRRVRARPRYSAPIENNEEKGTWDAAGIPRVRVKGNVVDLAVGVIIGAAFGKIVDRWWAT
jgi:hypothetical protein